MAIRPIINYQKFYTIISIINKIFSIPFFLMCQVRLDVIGSEKTSYEIQMVGLFSANQEKCDPID